MALSIRSEELEAVEREWWDLLPSSSANRVFATPAWARLWWESFSSGKELLLLAVRQDGRLIGLAPLVQEGDQIHLLGGSDVCDYLDFIVARGYEEAFYRTVLDYLEPLPWRLIHLESVPAGSPTLTHLVDEAARRAYSANCIEEDVCPRVDLPGDWDAYLSSLSKKDRHELRRKLRRLYARGDVQHVPAQDGDNLAREVDDFLRLYRQGKTEKVGFLTPEREGFFRTMTSRMAEMGFLRLCFLEVDGQRVSSVICFDYGDDLSLYNSGFDPAYQSLSVGLLLKAMCVREGIEAGKKTFDFLRGNEPYKYDLGGRDLTLYTCTIRR